MIIYHQAFDLYHAAYRIVQILSYFKRGEFVEVDRLRIWDYYLLFPLEMQRIKFSRDEKEIKDYIKKFITKGEKENRYEVILDNRKMFEKIRPYQMAALKSLASYGIINIDYISSGKVTPISTEMIEKHSPTYELLSINEANAVKLLTSHYYLMSLNILKEKTSLIEYKYDAQ
ncbi:ABC-three component system middle component 5 [Bacteroides sp. 51]|uniref:ABC-three component system middle component 5 n=1 Tax=Bacteroides sp. 51 TaxID=2302938 RepID=UPI0013D169E1|nr:ABC-three component system middle component 5 [Bacteroides sp. 51]NDV84800.1 hypothetical protein [Bacteroides sp. 51]